MKKKVYICLTVIVALLIIGCIAIYCALPKYIVYANRSSDDGPKREEVYRSIYYGKAKDRYYYLNSHKEEGVSGYILLDEEMGNSLIPF